MIINKFKRVGVLLKTLFSLRVIKILTIAICKDIYEVLNRLIKWIIKTIENIDIATEIFINNIKEKHKKKQLNKNLNTALKLTIKDTNRKVTIKSIIKGILTSFNILLIFLIGILSYLVIDMSTDLSEANEYISIMERDLNAEAELYTEQYKENQTLYIEIDSIQERSENLSIQVNELQKELKRQSKTTLELQTEEIRYLIKLSADAYNVDPYLALAISRHETGNWTSTLCLYSNNYGGLKASDGSWSSYDTAIKGINALCKTLQWYKNKGLTTIESMEYLYCPDGSDWAGAVRKFYNEEKNRDN